MEINQNIVHPIQILNQMKLFKMNPYLPYFGIINALFYLWSISTLEARVNQPGYMPKVSEPGVIQEYCQWEVFNASCSRGEVIVIQAAQYGRMELGRCLLRDYGYIGCGKSVLTYVDSR